MVAEGGAYGGLRCGDGDGVVERGFLFLPSPVSVPLKIYYLFSCFSCLPIWSSPFFLVLMVVVGGEMDRKKQDEEEASYVLVCSFVIYEREMKIGREKGNLFLG